MKSRFWCGLHERRHTVHASLQCGELLANWARAHMPEGGWESYKSLIKAYMVSHA